MGHFETNICFDKMQNGDNVYSVNFWDGIQIDIMKNNHVFLLF